jgi:cytochrome c553
LTIRYLHLTILGCALVALLASCSGEKPIGDISLGKTLASQGRGALPACNSCHGEKGEGKPQSAYPRLAGLDANYLLKQLKDYARDLPPAGVAIESVARDYSKTPRVYADKTVFTPGVRHDAVMSAFAKQLSDADRQNLAAYYASLGFSAIPIKAEYETLERGQDLALRGKPEYGLPGCISCHAPDGEGFGAEFPPLAGQSPQYLVEQINRWQRGERDNDPMGMMKSIADQLTDADKLTAAAYYANRSLVVKAK